MKYELTAYSKRYPVSSDQGSGEGANRGNFQWK
jgi:hypothetical protein